MIRKTDYTSNSQQRLLNTQSALSGFEDTGITPGELAKRAGSTASNVTRDLFNLKLAGYAEEIPGATGRWRLGPKALQQGIGLLHSRDRAQSRLDELNHFTRMN